MSFAVAMLSFIFVLLAFSGQFAIVKWLLNALREKVTPKTSIVITLMIIFAILSVIVIIYTGVIIRGAIAQ